MGQLTRQRLLWAFADQGKSPFKIPIPNASQAHRLRRAVVTICQRVDMAERHACQVLGPPRSTQRYQAQSRNDEETLTKGIVRLARQYGRDGYRRITALLQTEGWRVNYKRAERMATGGGEGAEETT